MKSDKTISSRDIARITGKRHSNILRDIKHRVDDVRLVELVYLEVAIPNNAIKLVPIYMLNNKAVSILNQWYKNPQLAELCGQKVLLSTSRFEVSFSNILLPILDKMGIEIVRQFKVLNYKIDFYIPEYKLAIEYDEEQHRFSVKSDAKRMDDIRKEIDCKFIRLSYKDSDAENVGIVLKEIYAQIRKADIRWDNSK